MAIDQEINNVQDAGANRPLWLIRENASEIEIIKPKKQAIDGFTNDQQLFDSHELNLQSGDTFYIFPDGYPDSFGGENNTKLTTKKSHETLLEFQDKTMEEQEAFLNNF